MEDSKRPILPVIRQWWGPLDEKLHLFDGYSFSAENRIRTGDKAACGWAPCSKCGVLESPDEPTPERRCEACAELAEESAQ